MYKICHTEESSRRQRELEAGLLAMMAVQSYDKITLTALCRELNVPRKTFYRYFPGKEDCLLALVDHTLSDCNDIALRGWMGGGRLDREVLLRFFRFWRERRALLVALERNGLEGLLLERTEVIVARMKHGSRVETFARDQVEHFIAQGLMSTVLRWSRLGWQSEPEELAQVFGKLLGELDVSLDSLLL